MTREQIVDPVAKEIVWWLGERRKKLEELRHETMGVNPFLIPLILGMHSFQGLDELAAFLVIAHFSTGYATGFGKLMDEKILPNVFGTKKLNKAARKEKPFSRSVFDEVDHIVTQGSKTKLLSLKASRWSIQLTMAVQLNKALSELIQLRDAGKLGSFTFDEIAVGVFYGTKAKLTDKYDILRGINRGAKHDVVDITNDVHVYAGKEFWAWLNKGIPETHEWVLEGILKGLTISQHQTGSLRELIDAFGEEFAKNFESFVRADKSIDWRGILRKING
jgi:hypothetical protein